MEKQADKNANDILDKLSRWQRNLNEKHPLFSQFLVKLIAGIVVTVITAFIGLAIVPPRPTYKINKISESKAQLIIDNEGFLPASDVYNIASGPVVTLAAPNMISGQDYSKIEHVTQNSFTINFKDLPRGQKVVVDIATSDTVQSIGDITVTRKE